MVFPPAASAFFFYLNMRWGKAQGAAAIDKRRGNLLYFFAEGGAMPYRRPIAKNAAPSGPMTLPKIRNKEKKYECYSFYFYGSTELVELE